MHRVIKNVASWHRFCSDHATAAPRDVASRTWHTVFEQVTYSRATEMKVEDLRYYGKGFSDAEGSWPPDVIKRMKRAAMKVIAAHVTWGLRPRFMMAFVQGRRRARSIDLSDLRERGMTNESFLATQLDYLAMFWALAELFDTQRAVEIMTEVMDASAREPMIYCLPRPENVYAVGPDPLETFADYFAPVPDAARAAGCNAIDLSVSDDDGAISFNVTWCVWLELATRMGVPEACQPNCYSDQIIFPEYFAELGIEYTRTQTLACGGTCCDFHFARERTEHEA